MEDDMSELPRLLRVSDLVNNPKVGRRGMLGMSRAALTTMLREGRFPKPLILGSRTPVWRLEDVEAFLSAKAKEAGV